MSRDIVRHAFSHQNVRLRRVRIGFVGGIDGQIEGPSCGVSLPKAFCVFETVEECGDGGYGAVGLVDLCVESSRGEEEVVEGVFVEVVVFGVCGVVEEREGGFVGVVEDVGFEDGGWLWR